jgi:hypothetical protein
VHDAWGVQRRRAGADDWSLVASGPLADGDALRVSTSGGVLWTTRGAVFLAPRARASVVGELRLDAGKAMLEGAGRLRTPDGVVIADGHALVEVLRGRTSVAALRGHLSCVQDERRVEVAAGQSSRMTRAEIAPPEDLRDAPPLAWLEQLKGHARPPRPLGPGGPPPGPGPGPGPGGPPPGPGPGPGAPRGGLPPGPAGPPPGPHGPPPPRPGGGGSPGAIHPRGSPT